MAKVVTSQGLQDFVETGKPTEVIATEKKVNEKTAPPLEVVGQPTEEQQVNGHDKTKTVETKSEDTGLEAEDHDLADRAKKRIGKKHYEMKKAQEEAAKAKADAEEAERFAETLFNEREEWKRKAEEAEKKAQEAAKTPAVPKVELKEPDENDPKYVIDGKFQLKEFTKDSIAYDKAKEQQQVEAARAKQLEEQTKAEKERIAKEFGERMEAAQKKYPDWKETVTASTITLQNECLQYIAQSEYGTDLAYFLAQPKNKDIAEKIRAMHPIRAIAELGKLETSFEKPAAKVAEKTEATDSLATSKTVETKGAPAPITPISMQGSGSINVDPSKMSFRELRAYERDRNKRH